MQDKQTAKKKSGLGGSPLSLFAPTTYLEEKSPTQIEITPELEQQEEKTVEVVKPKKTTKAQFINQDKTSELEFLVGVEGNDKESIGLQVTTELNDWLDEVVKASRRKNGKKLKKQIIIQAGVELLRAMPVDWTDIGDLDELRGKLSELSRVIEENRP